MPTFDLNRQLGQPFEGQMAASRIVRWILLVPGTITAWYVPFLLLMALAEGMGRFCAPDQVIAANCGAPWYRGAATVLLILGAAAGSVVAVFASAAIAPAHKRAAASVMFAAASVIVIALGLKTGEYATFIAAVGGGALALWMLFRRRSVPVAAGAG